MDHQADQIKQSLDGEKMFLPENLGKYFGELFTSTKSHRDTFVFPYYKSFVYTYVHILILSVFHRQKSYRT